MAALICLSFTSCRDDAELPGRGPVVHPEIETAGTYTGNWTRVDLSTNEEVVVPGTITLTASDRAYVSQINVNSPGIDLDRTAMCNVSAFSNGYWFYNTDPNTDIKGQFKGTISLQGEIDIYFQNSFKEGRKTITYTYSFTGVKAGN